MTFQSRTQPEGLWITAQHGVGYGHAPTQLRVGCRERHNIILGCDFRVLAFKWGWFIEIMTHQ
jgi:hypothetical protein